MDCRAVTPKRNDAAVTEPVSRCSASATGLPSPQGEGSTVGILARDLRFSLIILGIGESRTQRFPSWAPTDQTKVQAFSSLVGAMISRSSFAPGTGGLGL